MVGLECVVRRSVGAVPPIAPLQMCIVVGPVIISRHVDVWSRPPPAKAIIAPPAGVTAFITIMALMAVAAFLAVMAPMAVMRATQLSAPDLKNRIVYLETRLRDER